MDELDLLLTKIRQCTLCKEELPFPPKPVLKAKKTSQIMIVGQAPGTKVQASGIPWDDQSGKRLRQWMGVTDEQFYDESLFAIIPMGFCYPGKGKSGDLPPKKICGETWHPLLQDQLPSVKLTLLIGQYAQKYYLGDMAKRTLTETVRNYEAYLPNYLVMPHPSPRNGIWLRKNQWFEEDVVPILKLKVAEILGQ